MPRAVERLRQPGRPPRSASFDGTGGLLLRTTHPTPATLAELCNLQNPDRVDGGCGVAGFEEAVLERVRLAQARLRAAQEADDPIEEAQAVEELEDALRMARDHGVDTDDEGSP